MAKIAYIVGTGSMEVDGKQINYPVHKLLIANKRGDELEIKLDKINRKLLTYVFDLKDTGTMVQDENGVQCKMYNLTDNTQNDED